MNKNTRQAKRERAAKQRSDGLKAEHQERMKFAEKLRERFLKGELTVDEVRRLL